MAQDELITRISSGCASLGQNIDDEKANQLVTLLTELEHWGGKVNLTAIRNADDMIGAHLLDSIAVRPFLQGERIADIGTGAGFPGLPLAITEPERTFLLIDSNGKKISFVKHIIAKLGLQNVEAVKVRAENYAPERSFDTVVARALATIRGIIEFGGHLVAQKGVLLALKGRYPAEELELVDQLTNPWDWTVEKISIPGLEQHARHIVRLNKTD